MRYSNKVVVFCWVLILCLVLAGSEKSPAQSKNNKKENPSVETSNNKQWAPEKWETVKVTEVLRVAYLPATHDTLLFIALQEQFFVSYGLRVEMRSYANSPKALAALESGEVDIAIPGIAAPLYRIAAGAPLRIVGGEAWYSAGIVAKRDLMPKEGAKDKALLEPFKGKRIATITQSTGDAILRGKVMEYGLNGEIDIRTYSTPAKVENALLAGEVDAAMLWSPYMSLIEKKDEQMTVVVWAGQLIDHPCCRQVTTVNTQNDKREALIRYMSGIIMAKEFMSDTQNAVKVLADVKQYISNIPDDILKKELFVIDNYLGKKRTELSPNNSPKEINDYAKMMIDSKLISSKSAPRIEKSVDTDILTEAYMRVYPSLTKEVAEACAKSGLLSHESIRKLNPHLGGSGQ